jgi:hypothetical protein
MQEKIDEALLINVELLSLAWDRYEEIATEILNDPNSLHILRADARAVTSACSEVFGAPSQDKAGCSYFG